MFDLDDFDAAIAELDARYLAGEAAAHARTWSASLAGTRRSTDMNIPRPRQTRSPRPPTGDSDGAGDLLAYIGTESDPTPRQQGSTSRLCIVSPTSERSSLTQHMKLRKRVLKPSGEGSSVHG